MAYQISDIFKDFILISLSIEMLLVQVVTMIKANVFIITDRFGWPDVHKE